MLESQPGDSVTHEGDTAGGRGSGTEDQTGLGTPGEGLLRNTFKPPGGVRPYHRMVGRVSSLPHLSESRQQTLIATSCHSFKNKVHRHSWTGVNRRILPSPLVDASQAVADLRNTWGVERVQGDID